MIYCEEFNDGTMRVICFSDELTDEEILDFLEMENGEILKMKKIRILKNMIFAILSFGAAAAFMKIGKIKIPKA